MTTSQDRALHPIAKAAIASLEPFEGNQYALSQNGGERLQQSLTRLFKNGSELRPAVVSLISVAKFLDDHGQRKAADQLLWIAGTASSALRKLGATAVKLADDLGEITRERFARFNGRSAGKAAPKIDSKAEEGTVTVASFAAFQPRRA